MAVATYITFFKLAHIELVVGAFLFHELRGVSFFDDGAAIDDEDAVRLLDGGKPVGDDEGDMVCLKIGSQVDKDLIDRIGMDIFRCHIFLNRSGKFVNFSPYSGPSAAAQR